MSLGLSRYSLKTQALNEKIASQKLNKSLAWLLSFSCFQTLNCQSSSLQLPAIFTVVGSLKSQLLADLSWP